MKFGLMILALAYALSQFYRAFLPVLTPVLQADIGATAEDLSFASGVWFLVFAAMQIPVGSALDRIGPRITATVLFAVGGAGGSLMFALAQTPAHITIAMALLGIGCSPVMMAAYYIFARQFPAALFATLATGLIGLGSLGNIAGSTPLAWAVEVFGWRPTLGGLAAVSLAVAIAVGALVRDPERIKTGQHGSLLDLLKIPSLWPIFAMMFVNYAPAAGLRGLWVGPYVADMFGADTMTIGRVSLVMGIAMVLGNFAYGPMDRLFGSRKWVVLCGNAGVVVGLAALVLVGPDSIVTATVLFAVVGFAGSSYGLIIAHGRAFMPAHLTGRGVTLMNLMGIGGAGIAQMASGRIFATVSDKGADAAPYNLLFVLFAVAVILGLVAYLFSKDRTD